MDPTERKQVINAEKAHKILKVRAAPGMAYTCAPYVCGVVMGWVQLAWPLREGGVGRGRGRVVGGSLRGGKGVGEARSCSPTPLTLTPLPPLITRASRMRTCGSWASTPSGLGPTGSS